MTAHSKDMYAGRAQITTGIAFYCFSQVAHRYTRAKLNTKRYCSGNIVKRASVCAYGDAACLVDISTTGQGSFARRIFHERSKSFISG